MKVKRFMRPMLVVCMAWSQFIFFIIAPIDRAIADETELEIIREAINKYGLDWTANETEISRLTPDERQMRLGALEANMLSSDILEFEMIPDAECANRSIMDWRNYNGSNWMTSVKDQGNCGSCGAFASVGAVEALVRISLGNPGYSIDLSEQHLFSCGGGNCVNGWTLTAAMEYFKSLGVPDDACLPYTQVDWNCNSTCPDWQSRVTQIGSWSYVTANEFNDNALRSAVAINPIPCRMNVYSDFYYYSGGIYEPYPGSTMDGGHFVVVVGWDDAQDCWICKNSWGPYWGENGYFYIRRGVSEFGNWAHWPKMSGANPTPTSTPPTGPATPSPTSTPPSGPVTPTPSSTPPTNPATPTPSFQAGVSFVMPQKYYSPGDVFYIDAICYNYESSIPKVSLMVMLDVYGEYFFWPSWAHYPPHTDYEWIPLANGSAVYAIIDPFYWPSAGGPMTGLAFWGAILSSDLSALIGNIGFIEWGFYPN